MISHLKKVFIVIFCMMFVFEIIGQSINQELSMEKVSEVSLILQAKENGDIGIFATHDIPAGAEVFSKIYNLRTLNPKTTHIPK